MWLAQVINVPDLPMDIINEAVEETKRYKYDVFYSEGTFPMNEKGHSLIVVQSDWAAPVFGSEFFPRALVGTGAHAEFAYSREEHRLPQYEYRIKEGGRKAEIHAFQRSDDLLKIITPEGGIIYRRSFRHIFDVQEYLRDMGHIFTAPETDRTRNFYHSTLIITDAGTYLYIGRPLKTYLEK